MFCSSLVYLQPRKKRAVGLSGKVIGTNARQGREGQELPRSCSSLGGWGGAFEWAGSWERRCVINKELVVKWIPCICEWSCEWALQRGECCIYVSVFCHLGMQGRCVRWQLAHGNFYMKMCSIGRRCFCCHACCKGFPQGHDKLVLR